MSRPDLILEHLPPPHQDEPEHLRRDILDELADHLECATRSERRRTDDPQAAQAAALARFGNPRQIARRLWLDAMKEQLMNQRILVVGQLGALAAVVVLCVVVIVALRQNQRLQEALLARLEAASAQTAASPTTSFDWPRLQVQALQPDGSAGLADVEARLSGEPYSPGAKQSISLRTDAEGRAIFGPMRPGIYQLSVSHKRGGSTSRQLVVPPGPEQPPVVIQWPDVQHRPVSVRPGVEMPKEIGDVPWLLTVYLASHPRAIAGRNSIGSGIRVDLASHPRAIARNNEHWQWDWVRLVFDHQGRVAVLPPESDVWDSHPVKVTQADLDEVQWTTEITLDAALLYVPQNGQIFVASNDETEPLEFNRAHYISNLEPASFEISGEAGERIQFRPDSSLVSALQRDRQRAGRQPQQEAQSNP